MKSDPVPREKTGGGQVFRAWRGAGCWSRGSRFVIRWQLAPARPSLPNISTSLPPPRPPSPHRSLSLWYDIIVEFIVTLLKHHSYLFLSLSLLFSSSLSPLSKPKKGEHKSYRQDALRPPNFPQDRRPWCRRHLGTYIPFHLLSRRLSVKWRRKEQEVETLPHTSSGRSRRTRRAGLDGRHVYRDRSGSWAGTTRPLSLLSSLNTDGVALALAGMHWIASLTLVSYHIGPNCRCPRCRRRRYQVLCYRQAW